MVSRSSDACDRSWRSLRLARVDAAKPPVACMSAKPAVIQQQRENWPYNNTKANYTIWPHKGAAKNRTARAHSNGLGKHDTELDTTQNWIMPISGPRIK